MAPLALSDETSRNIGHSAYMQFINRTDRNIWQLPERIKVFKEYDPDETEKPATCRLLVD
jgi:hypothetical protein